MKFWIVETVHRGEEFGSQTFFSKAEEALAFAREFMEATPNGYVLLLPSEGGKPAAGA